MQRHRSFRLTQPEYMRGKRMKWRLVFLTWLSSLLSIAVTVLSLFGCVTLRDFLAGAAAWPAALDVVAVCTSFVVAIFAGFLTYLGLKRLYVRKGLLSPEEARSFGEKRHWPDESWLEPKPGSTTESAEQRP
jgi:hypothetical protein